MSSKSVSQIFKILFFKLEISALHGQSEQLSAKEQSLKYALSEQEKQQNDITEVVCSAGRNCKKLFCCCHQIKLQQQVKL